MGRGAPIEVGRPSRLAAVDRTGLHGSHASQPSFSRLVDLAVELLDAPSGFFTIVDAERSWYVTTTGVPDDLRSGEVEASFCKYVIASRQPLLVSDAATDARTRGNPAIESMGVRAWAGMPVFDPDGEVLGSFCVVDTETHQWTDRDEAVLKVLAAAATDEIAHLLARQAVDEASAALDDLRERQRQLLELIQVSLLPADLPEVSGLEVAVRYEPANDTSEMGGDWYDVIDLGDERAALVIADVSGHDAQAVAVMAQLRPSLHVFARQGAPPATVLRQIHDLMLELRIDRFLTILYAIWQPADRTVTFQAAGHPPPFVLRRDGSVQRCGAGRTGLLGLEALTPEGHEQVVELGPGDTFVSFTDGLFERRDRSIDDALDALVHHAGRLPTRPPDDFADALMAHARAEGGDDDIALLVARVPDRGAPAPPGHLDR